MRFQIITLVAFIVSSSVFAVPVHSHGDLQSGQSVKTHVPKSTEERLKRLEDEANGLKQSLEAALRAYNHPRGPSHHQRRGNFGDEVRLDAHDKKTTKEEADRKLRQKASGVIAGAETGGAPNPFELAKLIIETLKQASF
jgi:hypothetical protein